jgi:hypothetical protein
MVLRPWQDGQMEAARTQPATPGRLRLDDLLTRIRPRPRSRVALAALRSSLDPPSVGASWTIDADGLVGRGLLMSALATATYPLALDGETAFRARLMLLPHDWRVVR